VKLQSCKEPVRDREHLVLRHGSARGRSGERFHFWRFAGPAHQVLNGGNVPDEQDTFSFRSVIPQAVPDTGSTFSLLLLPVVALLGASRSRLFSSTWRRI